MAILSLSASPAMAVTGVPTDLAGGRATVAMVGSSKSLNPLLDRSDVIMQLRPLLWAAPFRLDPETLRPEPWLVLRIPTRESGDLRVMADGTLRVILRIRPEAVWDDGTPVTADDFVFTHEVLTGPSVANDLSPAHGEVVPGSVTGTGRRVEFRLASPSLDWLDAFPFLLPAHALSGSEAIGGWTSWPSAAPFRVETYVPGGHLLLERNPRYWEQDEAGRSLPYLSQLDIVFAGSREDLDEGFRQARFDVIGTDPGSAARLATLPGAAAYTMPGEDWEHLAFEVGPGREVRNPESLVGELEFRRAVAMALDRSRIAEVAGVSSNEVASSAVTQAVGPGGPWSMYHHDPAAAREQLKALKRRLGPGTELSLALSVSDALARRRVAAAIERQLEAVGIAVTVERLDVTTLFADRVIPGTFETATWAWVTTPGPAGSVDDAIEWFFTSPADGGYQFAGWGIDGVGGTDLTSSGGDLSEAFDLSDAVGALENVDRALAEQALLI
ncbi:MAG TPA: ABC transporter substrate-binding protein, partial [Acidimicrobiia bacterium]|nr:ABC transporter substrate-binding protein [Acidimicrobiia bacterium]